VGLCLRILPEGSPHRVSCTKEANRQRALAVHAPPRRPHCAFGQQSSHVRTRPIPSPRLPVPFPCLRRQSPFQTWPARWRRTRSPARRARERRVRSVTRAALTFVVLTRKPPSLSRPFSTLFALRSQSAALSRARVYSDRVPASCCVLCGAEAEECSNPSVTWKAGVTFFFFAKNRRAVLFTTVLNKHRPTSDEKIKMLLVIHILVPQIKQRAGKRS
jgi:hypothetical protein